MTKHLNQAKRNEDFLIELEKHFPDQYHDWKITVIFYIAIHYLDAYFASHEITITDHFHRRKEMSSGASFEVSEDCLDNYNELYYSCKGCRYNGFLNKEVHDRHLKYKCEEAKKNLKVIKAFVMEDLAEVL